MALVVHVLEEWPTFPSWATEHFGTTSSRFYVVSHIPIFAVFAWAAWRASRARASNKDLWVLTILISALATNALFHLVSSAVHREWSPGVITAAFVYVPLWLWMIPNLRIALGRTSTNRVIITGFVVSAFIAASLWLDMPVL